MMMRMMIVIITKITMITIQIIKLLFSCLNQGDKDSSDQTQKLTA